MGNSFRKKNMKQSRTQCHNRTEIKSKLMKIKSKKNRYATLRIVIPHKSYEYFPVTETVHSLESNDDIRTFYTPHKTKRTKYRCERCSREFKQRFNVDHHFFCWRLTLSNQTQTEQNQNIANSSFINKT